MANEILYAGLADQRTAEILSGEYLRMLAARESLPNHPALVYGGDAAGTGSIVVKVPHLGLDGYDLPNSVADGSAIANTALSDSSTAITVARYSKAYEISDLARLSDRGLLSPQAFAQDAVVSSAALLVSLVAPLMSGFSQTVGTSGVDLSIAQYFSAIGTLEVNNVPGPYLAILHPQQVADLRAAIAASSAGAIQWLPESQEQVRLLGNGFRGTFGGVQIFSTTYVPTVAGGADRGGGMFGKGAVLWADASIPASNSSEELIIGGKVLFERDREPKQGLTQYVTHRFVGVSEGIDLAGCQIATDA
jgi:hypothetical protein